MKIVYVITALTLGGAEVQLKSLISKMDLDIYDVTIIALTGDVAVRFDGLKVHLIELNMSKSFFSIISSFLKFCKVLKSINPDIVHSHMYHANIFSRSARIFVNIKRLICSAHSTTEGGKLSELLYRYTDFLCDITTNVSNTARQLFVEKNMSKDTNIITAYNGIDTEVFKFCKESRSELRSLFNYNAEDFIFLAVGKFKEAKNYPLLVKSFAHHYENNCNSRLLIVGDGPLRSDIEKIVDSLQLNHVITFAGNRSDIPEIMSSCDAFILSSAWEGFGLVVAEAMSCERPVIATDCGGVSEVILDTQFLVPPADSVLLTQKMDVLVILSNDELLRIGLLNRNYIIDKFSIDGVLKFWLETYQ